MPPLLEPYASFWQRYRVTIVALAAIAGLSVGGLYARGGPIDIGGFLALNAGLANPILDQLANVGYALGSFAFSLGLFVALFLAGYRRLAVAAIGAIIVGALLILLIKALTQQPRPAQQLAGVRLVGVVAAAGLGYPSGHAGQGFLTAFLLDSYFLLRWYARVGLYGLAAFIALSRLYAGMHLPVDLIVGGAIGVLVGAMWVHSRLWPPAGEGRER